MSNNWESPEIQPTYLEILIDQKADDIGRTSGEQREDSIRDYGALEFRLELLDAHEGRLERQKKEAMAELQKNLNQFYQMQTLGGAGIVVGRILTSAKTLGRIEGELFFLRSYIDAQPDTPDE